jgi:hypothetical protein
MQSAGRATPAPVSPSSPAAVRTRHPHRPGKPSEIRTSSFENNSCGFRAGGELPADRPSHRFSRRAKPLDSSTKSQARNANIQHPMPNIQRRTEEKKRRTLSFRPLPLPFNVRRSMFNVRRSCSLPLTSVLRPLHFSFQLSTFLPPPMPRHLTSMPGHRTCEGSGKSGGGNPHFPALRSSPPPSPTPISPPSSLRRGYDRQAGQTIGSCRGFPQKANFLQ